MSTLLVFFERIMPKTSPFDSFGLVLRSESPLFKQMPEILFGTKQMLKGPIRPSLSFTLKPLYIFKAKRSIIF